MLNFPDPMSDPQTDPSLGTLFTRLADDGKAYVKAELAFVRAQGEAAVRSYRNVVLFGAGAALFALVALIILFVAIGAGLATLIGPFGGFAAAAALAGAIAGLLALSAQRALGKR